MNHLTPLNILLLFSGLILKLLYSLKKRKQKGELFSAGYYIKTNWIDMLITIVCSFTSLLMADDIISFLNVKATDGSSFYTFHAFLSGVASTFIIDKILKFVGLDTTNSNE